jgi:alkyl hydroperoxide reductase subunit AhpC
MEKNMSLHINDTVPTFKANTSEGEIDFHDWIGDSWAILFSHPKDFTPVCTTEFGAVAKLAPEWAKRNTKVIGISVDGVDDHKKWIADIEKYSGSQVSFPIIADEDLKIAKLYDMLPSEAILPDGRTAADSATVRSVFIIGPDKKLKLSMTYPMTIGRNFAEVMRALDALQASSSKNVATPADWSIGQDVIIPMTVSNDEAQEKYGDYETIFPYLRKTSFPS